MALIDVKDANGVTRQIDSSTEAKQTLQLTELQAIVTALGAIATELNQKLESGQSINVGNFPSNISGFSLEATQVVIGNLLTALNLKIDALQTELNQKLEAGQSVNVGNFPTTQQVNLITGFNLQDTQLLIKAVLESIDGRIATTNLNVDELEPLITALNGYNTTMAGILAEIDTNSDGLEGLLTAIGANTDQLEAYQQNTTTAIQNLITELALKADLTETQPVNIQNQISGFSTEATLLLVDTVLDNILAKIIAAPATEAKQNDEITQVTNLNTAIGARADASATTDSGTFSFISLFKRLLGKFQVAGQFLLNSIGVALPRKESITGFLSVVSTNTNLLDSAGTGIATDVRDFQSGELIVVSTATTGSYTVQVAFDSAFTIGVKTLQLFEKDVQNANPINAAITPTNTTRTFLMNLQGANFLRVNMTSAAANVRPYAVLNQASHIPNQFNIQQATAGNLNATVAGTVTANLGANSVITPVPQTGQGASTPHVRLSSADTNLILVKNGAGVINSMVLANLSASFKYFRIYNKASAPVIATDNALIVKYIPIPPNTTLTISTAPFGDRFATGIAYAITNAVGLTDTTNIAVNEVTVSIQYT